MDASIGFISLANKPATKSAPLVDILLDLGAVLYCKTNVPQTMMTADSDNNIFGRTLNPNNTSLTAGGSTGGEGALIALHGSVLGVGTDIAGSIRIPAMCNGIYGFKPTSSVFPFGGQASPVAPGTPVFNPTAGPLATSIRACNLLLQNVMLSEPWNLDYGCARLPWMGKASLATERKLRVGIVEDDGIFSVWPPMARGLRTSVEKLTAAGVEVVPIKLPSIHKEMIDTCWQFFLMDGGKVTISRYKFERIS
jgi:amidase